MLTAAGLGIGAAQGVFWTLPGALGIGDGRPPVEAIALISMFGTAGGIIGPYVLGALVEATGTFTAGIAVLATLLLVAAALVSSFRSADRLEDLREDSHARTRLQHPARLRRRVRGCDSSPPAPAFVAGSSA